MTNKKQAADAAIEPTEPAQEVEPFEPTAFGFTHMRCMANGVTLSGLEQLVCGDVIALAYLVEETEARPDYLRALAEQVEQGAHPLFEAGNMVGGKFVKLGEARTETEVEKDAAKARKREPRVFE